MLQFQIDFGPTVLKLCSDHHIFAHTNLMDCSHSFLSSSSSFAFFSTVWRLEVERPFMFWVSRTWSFFQLLQISASGWGFAYFWTINGRYWIFSFFPSLAISLVFCFKNCSGDQKKIAKSRLMYYDRCVLWDLTKDGQWVLHAYTIANFVVSWLKNGSKWFQMTPKDFNWPLRHIRNHLELFN